MFDTTWADWERWECERDAVSLVQQEPTWNLPVTRLALTHWEEHCHECAVPQCYSECLVYRARADRRCRRFDYGCVPDTRFSGPLGYGIDVRFGRWAKLETEFHSVAVRPWLARHIDRVSRAAARCARWLSPWLLFNSPIKRATWALDHARNQFLRWGSNWFNGEFTAFAIEAYNLEPSAVSLMLQCTTPVQGAFYRRSLLLNPGLNRFVLPFDELGLKPKNFVRISVFPENDIHARILFTWLDFLNLAGLPGNNFAESQPAESRPADTVKCIAWDLDNTLWDGVLIDDGLEQLRLRDGVVEVVRELDKRGIIQTIVSKNSHEQAWAALEAMGLQEYFVFPAINWGRKSENIVQVARRLNIGLDTIAFIDDSAFEREEVKRSLPMVRVFRESHIPQLLTQPCLPLAGSSMGSQRRLSYRAEMLREEFKITSAGDDLAYLRACEIRAAFVRPQEPDQIRRCYELVQRSNQLNLCTRRYSSEEFEVLLARTDVEAFAMHCSDRFGDYGIIGFVSVQLGESPKLIDFVLSCRVAKRRVEHALIKWLAHRYMSQGHATLGATLVRTSRNHVLGAVFQELPFEVVTKTALLTEYILPLERTGHIEDVVTVARALPTSASETAL